MEESFQGTCLFWPCFFILKYATIDEKVCKNV